jgi:hypothetical protein
MRESGKALVTNSNAKEIRDGLCLRFHASRFQRLAIPCVSLISLKERKMSNVQSIRPLLVNSTLPTDDHSAAINQTASVGALVNSCCTAILQQPNMVVPAMPEMATHQQTTRDHANLWINTVQPALIGSIGGVVGFSNQFNAYLTPLINAAPTVNTDPKSKQTVIEGLKLLKTAATTQKSNSTLACQAVDSFRSNFSTDFVAFASDIDTLSIKLIGDNGENHSTAK